MGDVFQGLQHTLQNTGRLDFSFFGSLSSLARAQYSGSISDISTNFQATILSTRERGMGGRPSPTYTIVESPVGRGVLFQGSMPRMPDPDINGLVTACVVVEEATGPLAAVLAIAVEPLCPVPSVGRRAPAARIA